jgi:hypothetical protein
VVILLFYPDIIRVFTSSVKYWLLDLGYQPVELSWTMLQTDIPILNLLTREVPILDMPTVYPTPLFATTILLLSVILIIIVLLVPKFPRLLAVYLIFLSIINVMSAIFFILFPHQFPYTIAEFSILYIGTEIALWIMIPMILAIALYSLPSNLASKFIFILFNVVYSIVFGAIRYAAFLFMLDDYSVVFMALFYFAFGPLFDFVYLVGFYTLYASNLAEVTRHSFQRWRWLY